MSSLFGTMSMSLRALLAQQAALQTTTDNIANVNTDGYSRKRTVLAEDTAFLDGGAAVGNGVHVERVESLRDRVLELRINEETQQQGACNGFIGAMSQVESLFSDVDAGIGAQLDSFFNSITALQPDPSNVSRRQDVLIAADNLANAFVSTAQNLIGLQQTLNSGISQGVSQVNELAGQIANLNAEVTRLEKLGRDASTFEDQRTQLIRTLSGQIDVSVIDSDEGLTLTAANGAALVVGSKSFSLDTAADASGLVHVFSDTTDITSEVAGGNIAGLLRARDAGIATVLGDLNTFASDLATSLNQANRNGLDLNGASGEDIFSTPSAHNAAASLTVIMTDPKKLAASSDGTVGDNTNLASFATVKTNPTVAGLRPIDFYSGIVASVGDETATAKAESDATDFVLNQLQNQRGAISGVSLDEEAANLVRFQRAFEASARVVSVIDEMLQTVLAIGQH